MEGLGIMSSVPSRIVVLGNMGYVGPVLIRHLRAAHPEAELVGVDPGFFADCLTSRDAWPERHLDRQVLSDIRDIDASVFDGADAVVALAAISNDPMGAAFERVTKDINDEAIVRAAALAAQAGVKNFVLASSCSIYGFAEGAARDETAPVNPLTAYARSKIAAEAALQDMDAPNMVRTALRFATACGPSPRLRLDLVLNDFVACAVTTGKITVLSDGTPWRPLIDVRDMARAIEWAIAREPSAGGDYLAVNAGSDDWNYQITDLARAVTDAIPGSSFSVNPDAAPDNRSYRVDFSLYRQLAPAHQPQVGLNDSISGLRDLLSGIDFSDAEFRTSQLMRLRALNAHLDAGRLDQTLRWSLPQ